MVWIVKEQLKPSLPQLQLMPTLLITKKGASSSSIGVTWSGLLWYRKLKRCPMVTHSSKSSFSGRACSRAASTWTHRWFWPLAPHSPWLPGSAQCLHNSPGALVFLWDWPSVGGRVPHRCCHEHDHGAPVPGEATGAPAAWESVWFTVKK